MIFSICDQKLEKPKKYSQSRFVFEAIKGVIPKGLETDHLNEVKRDNRIENLQILTKKQNIEKSKNTSVVSVNIKNNEKKIFLSIKTASIELEISYSCISKICLKIENRKLATSKKDGQICS